MMVKSLQNFGVKLSLFSIVIGLLHYLWAEYAIQVPLHYTTAVVIGFLYVLTLLIYTFILYINFNFDEYTGYAFMGGSLLKMFVSIGFLFPVLTLKDAEKVSDLISFFIPYFLFLAFETYCVAKLLMSKDSK